MALIHDNALRRRFSNPYSTLVAAGLKAGQRVLEVGCGPGFFTIPAARMVTETGKIYALDIHPLAIKRVHEKTKKEKITNIKPILASATQTGLADQSIDLVFLFGIVHRIDGFFDALLEEMYRILQINGELSIQRSRPPKEKVIRVVERHRFAYLGDRKRTLLFRKSKE